MLIIAWRWNAAIVSHMGGDGGNGQFYNSVTDRSSVATYRLSCLVFYSFTILKRQTHVSILKLKMQMVVQKCIFALYLFCTFKPKLTLTRTTFQSAKCSKIGLISGCISSSVVRFRSVPCSHLGFMYIVWYFIFLWPAIHTHLLSVTRFHMQYSFLCN